MCSCILSTVTAELLIVYGAAHSASMIILCVYKTQQMQELSCDDGERLTVADAITAAAQQSTVT
jgi:hypothetical protein